MAKAYCPNCDAEVSMNSPRLGTMFQCPDCEVDLEVVSVNPFDVDFPSDNYDDWDDDDYDDES